MAAVEEHESRATRSPVGGGRAGAGWIGAVSAANLGLFIAYVGPLAVLLPNQVQAVAGDAHKVVALGWVTGVGAVVGMVANPLAGALSDRTAGRFGRRRPWVLGGALASAAALALLAGQHTVLGIIVGWSLGQAALNAMQAGVAAGVPDRVPVSQRATVSAWIGIAQSVSVIIAVVLVNKVVTGDGGYLLLTVPVVFLALPYALATRDEPLLAADREPFDLRGFLRSFAIDPRRYPDFAWAWLTRFLMVLGDSVAVLYLLYFLRDRIHYSTLFPGQKAEDGLAILLLVYTAVVVVSTVVGGVISDRTGRRRRYVALAGLLMALPALLLALHPTWTAAIAAAALLGVGFGLYLSIDQALITQVLPSSASHAKDMGVSSVASSAGQALAPAIAAPVVTYLGGYRTLYFCVAGIVVLGSIAVCRIRSVP